MSPLRFVSLSILAATIAAAASVALAASESQPVSRAEVKRQVLQARADRQLARPGEALQSFPLATTSGSTLSPQSVRDEPVFAPPVGQPTPAAHGGPGLLPPV